MNIKYFIAASVLMGFMASCSSDDLSQNSTDTGKETGNTSLTAFASAEQTDNISTRTSMDYSTGDFFWEKDDKLYVKDDDGGFQASSNAVDADRQAAFKFMMPGKYTKQEYKVYYPGAKTKEDHVVILDQQKQTAPDDTKNFGENGDCGLGKATLENGQYKFKLDHMVSYLALQPFTSRELKSTYITAIDVETSGSENIAGPYTLDAQQYKLTGTGDKKTITLTTKGTGTYENGFRLTKLDPGVEPYRAFVIIAPGEHKLTIRYHLKDIKTKVEGVMTKTLTSKEYKANNIYDIKSRLDMEEYSAKVYMWDALNDYWNGYEAVQPFLNSDPANNNYPKNESDGNNRWYNTTQMKTTGTKQAQHSAKDCPNINEALWYVFKGDPHWDNIKLWTIGGYLYKGGIWFKNALTIASDNGGLDVESLKTSFEGKDYRNGTKVQQDEFPKKYTLTSEQKTPPTDKTNYFYLPAIDNYLEGRIRNGDGRGMGLEGQYWTSTCYGLHESATSPYYSGAFNITVKESHIGIYRSGRDNGMRCVKFQ